MPADPVARLWSPFCVGIIWGVVGAGLADRSTGCIVMMDAMSSPK